MTSDAKPRMTVGFMYTLPLLLIRSILQDDPLVPSDL
jgi:hypothetical protein